MVKGRSETTMISNTCVRMHPYLRLTTRPTGLATCRAPTPIFHGRISDPRYRVGPLHADAVHRVQRARLRRIYDVQLRTLAWAAREVMSLRDPDPRCYVTPAYTGGPVLVAVDGRLRAPCCFGSRGEPWAQPLGTRATAHDFGAAAPEVVVEHHGSSGFSFRLREVT